MIHIKATTNENGTDVKVLIHGDKKGVTNELYRILSALDEKFPEILMNAIEMHIVDLADDNFEEDGDDD